jgi:carboxyl-terminal processing protease
VKKFIQITVIALLSGFILLGAFSGGVVFGHFSQISALDTLATKTDLGLTVLSTPEAAATATPSDLGALFVPFWETWDLLHKEYVDQPVDDVALMRGAIRGMLESLGDQHTSYMDPKEFKDENSTLAGNYEGIGAYVDTTGDFLTVISPISSSPAEKAGIRAGDVIVAINGEDMTGINPELVRQKVLGPAGSEVTLTIQRKEVDTPIEVTIIRAKITIASVESKMLENNVGYIKLNTFGETTTAELKSQLADLKKNGAKGFILDLRNNGGGYLVTAVEVSSQFVAEGKIVIEKYGDSRQNDDYSAIPGGLATDAPVVVLINEGSASASEIVAGALQDYERGKLVGVTSYGKGSVQIWTPLSNDQGAVRITIAKWLTPLGRTIHKVGLTPDVVVEMTEDDYINGLDPQLDAAIGEIGKLLK